MTNSVLPITRADIPARIRRRIVDSQNMLSSVTAVN